MSGKTWLGLLTLGLALWLLINHFGLFLQTLAALFAGYLLGLVLRVPADSLEHRFHVPRVLTASVTLLLLFAVPIILLLLLFPYGGALIDVVVNGAYELLALVDSGADQSLLPAIESAIGQLAESAGEVVVGMVDLLSGTLTVVGNFLLMLSITTVFATSVAVESDLTSRITQEWVAPSHRERLALALQRIDHTLSRWAVSQLVTMVFFAIAFGLGLFLMGVPFAAQIALFGGFWEIIPGLGALMAMILAMLAAVAVEEWWWIGAILVLYLVVVTLKTSFLSPIVFERRLRIHPVLMVLGVTVGIRVAGYWGAFFAVPVLVVLKVVLLEIQASYASWDEPAPTGATPDDGRRVDNGEDTA